MTRLSAFDIGRMAIRYRLIVVLLVVAVLGALTVNDFLTLGTFQSVLNRATIVGFLALGLTPVLIAGQIDLSVGSTLSMASITTIYLQPSVGNVNAALIGLGVGVVIGAVNAAIVVLLRISPIVATLATLLIFASMALLLTNSQPVSSMDPTFGIGLTSGMFGVLTPRSLMFVTAVVLMFVWLRYTPSGRRLYAVGSNPGAARSAGINTNAYIASSYLISGFCAGAAGVLQSLSTATGSPVAGAVMLIPAITAVVIGGTRLEGGRGSSVATFGGVIALGALTTVLEFNGVPSYTQAIYTGLLLILLITLDRLVDRDGRTAVRTHRRVQTETATPSGS